MKITYKQLRQIIKEEARTRDWTQFDDAKRASLESTSDEPVYYYSQKDSLMHTIVNGNVVGDSPRVVYGGLEYKNNWATLIQDNPEKFFGPTPEEAMLAEGNKMKITRRQLRQIIQEELNTSLAEGKKKRKKGQPKDQYLYSTDVANSEDEVAKHDAWAGGDNLNNPADWQKVLDMIKEELSKAAPFGSGMKQAKLDKDQKKVVGHT